MFKTRSTRTAQQKKQIPTKIIKNMRSGEYPTATTNEIKIDGKIKVTGNVIRTGRKKTEFGTIVFHKPGSSETVSSEITMVSDEFKINNFIDDSGTPESPNTFNENMEIKIKPQSSGYGSSEKPVKVTFPNTWNVKQSNNTSAVITWNLWSTATTADGVTDYDNQNPNGTFVDVVNACEPIDDYLKFNGNNWESESELDNNTTNKGKWGYLLFKTANSTLYRTDEINGQNVDIYVDSVNKTITAKIGDSTYSDPIYYPFRNDKIDENATLITPTAEDTYEYGNAIIFGSSGSTDTVGDLTVNETIKHKTDTSIKDEIQTNVNFATALPAKQDESTGSVTFTRYNKNVLKVAGNETPGSEWIINEEITFNGSLKYEESVSSISNSKTEGDMQYYAFGESTVAIESNGKLLVKHLTGRKLDADGDDDETNQYLAKYELNLVGLDSITVDTSGEIECSELVL